MAERPTASRAQPLGHPVGQDDPVAEDDLAVDDLDPDDPVPAGLREPVEHSFEAAGQPERKLRPTRRRVRRRAERAGTNPTAEDVPDVVPPRDPGAADETGHDRWMREQRPPHWD